MKSLILLLLCAAALACGESEADRAAKQRADSARVADSLAALLAPRRAIYDAAIGIVKQRLKAPATAHFADVTLADDSVAILLTSDTTAMVNGQYDSQNAFGTYLHGHYQVRLTKRGDQWQGSFTGSYSENVNAMLTDAPLAFPAQDTGAK